MSPSTFANAAAGGNSNSSRGENSNEWARRSNGATQTFRRQSGATSSAATNQQREQSSQYSTNVYIPPHLTSNRSTGYHDTRYSRSQLLDLYRVLDRSEEDQESIMPLFVGGWEQNLANGSPEYRRDEMSRDNLTNADVCWAHDGLVSPVGLVDLSEDEKRHFTTSVNSLLKSSVQTPREPPKEGMSLRKPSVSQYSQNSSSFGPGTPTSARPTGRRREASESYPFPTSASLASPSTNQSMRPFDNVPASPPPALQRRRTDFKAESEAASKQDQGTTETADGNSSSTSSGLTVKKHTTATQGVQLGASLPSWSPTTASAPSPGFGALGGFGSFGFGNAPAASSTERRPGFGSVRASSRFKDLMSEGSLQESDHELHERPSLGKLTRDSEMEAMASKKEHRPRLSGQEFDGRQSADFPDQGRYSEYNEQKTSPAETSQHATARLTDHGVPSDLETSHHNDQLLTDTRGSMSPTNTNPYQSPEATPSDVPSGDPRAHQSHLPGLGNLSGFDLDAGTHGGPMPGQGNTLPNPGAFGVARGGNKAMGSMRGFPETGGLPGLGGVSGWSMGDVSLQMAGREKMAFPDNQSYNGFPSSSGSQGIQPPGPGSNRPSRLGSLFPQAMQEQMRGGESTHLPPLGRDGTFGNERNDLFGRGDFHPGPEEMAMRSGPFDPLSKLNYGEGRQPGSGPNSMEFMDSQNEESKSSSQGMPSSQGQRLSQSTENWSGGEEGRPTSAQPPQSQQRQMVMPDRMRWVYRDPQGNRQGPWSGLEMHDWYKAGFFTPELLVKKLEDPDYEPLAQLIRRIGNSREPFLVPQIGIPHGPEPAQGGNAWAGPGATAAPPGGAQPPFASSFPSFGTTLTAEQQNALERRKQEEQYLMARQKEYLAQQQAMARQMQGQHPIMGGQLNHHSSAQSLHSQPSFGSITSPAGYQPSPTQHQAQQAHNFGSFREGYRQPGSAGFGAIGPHPDSMNRPGGEDYTSQLERLSIGRQHQGSLSGNRPPNVQQFDQAKHDHMVSAMMRDRARLEQEQNQQAFQQQQEFDPHPERLQQFQELRSSLGSMDMQGPPLGSDEPLVEATSADRAANRDDLPMGHNDASTESLSLTEQVQKAASAQQTPAHAWNKIDQGHPQPFPPPPSQSPLPAPAAQRNRSNVAEALTAESRESSESPTIETPSTSVAPWAREPAEAPKGPSLREIQEAEAKKAAQREEIAAATRRANLERDLAIQAQVQAQASASPGLPTTSTWGSSGSPSAATASNASAWKTAPTKPPSTTNGSKKTLQQIQKEEEARKKVAVASKTATKAASGATTAGKRYADLAGKPTGQPSPSEGSWTTVGAGGSKPRPAAQQPTSASPAKSTPVAAPLASAATRAKASPRNGAVNSKQEFLKWVADTLRPDYKGEDNAETFASDLVNYPQEPEIIGAAVHSRTSNIDADVFAREYLRRRRLADKGTPDISKFDAKKAAESVEGKDDAGWNVVAAKGPAPTKESADTFRTVPAKKKGGKR